MTDIPYATLARFLLSAGPVLRDGESTGPEGGRPDILFLTREAAA